MAISKKGSRKIIVENAEFRWNATGNDGWITIVICSLDNNSVKLIGTFQYHDEHTNEKDNRGAYLQTKGQIIITNRVIRQIILQVGIDKIFSSKGQINLGQLEKYYNINDALRVPLEKDSK